MILIFFECNSIYVEDVKDRSNTPKGCNDVYVKDVEDWKRTYTHILYRVYDMSKVLEMSFSFSMNVMLSMSKMLKIGQIHLRAVMLCMSKMSKIQKEHTYTFLLITFLIFNRFSILKKFWKAESQSFSTILFLLKHVEDVKDRSSTLKGCNAMYVKDIEDGKRTYPHIFAHNFLHI